MKRQQMAMRPRQQGLTLVEMMIGLTLSMLVVGASTAVFLSTASTYRNEEDVAELQDGGRFALELLGRITRQTQFENWDPENGAPINSAAWSAVHKKPMSPAIRGANNASAPRDGNRTIGEHDSGRQGGSDAIQLRYFGVSRVDDASESDGTVIDCAGNGTPGPSSIDAADEERGTSIFFVGKDGQGEQNLYCKYKGKTKFMVEPLIRGVESFQILYGLDTGTQDSYPNTFVRADEIGSDDEWRRVVAIKYSLLLRGRAPVSMMDPGESFSLFGNQYDGTDDPGTIVDVSDTPEAQRAKPRKIFSTTVFLRNVVHE
jgi:type IV pilus assembly protein PilW